MPKKKTGRGALGAGNIRQRKDGKWEARYTAGFDPGTGKQIQRSIYGKTQKEVLKKLQQAQSDLETGSYVEPSKMTLGEWLDIWLNDYLVNIKQSTAASYSTHIRIHIKPALGAVQLQKLHPHQIQGFINGLSRKGKAPKTVKNIHGTFHEALDQAVKLGYLRSNPTEVCNLPRVVRPEIKVMPDDMVSRFLSAILGHALESLFFVVLFTGLRQGEILGLAWDGVDFDNGTLLINKQLKKEKMKAGKYFIDTTKHDKVRTIRPSSFVMAKLKERKAQQAQDQLMAGSAWDNPWNLVFTNALGGHLVHHTVRTNFKRIVADLGEPELTFHSMRHSYVVISLMNGDDIKTVQNNTGHYASSFMLDTYGHVLDKMKQESASRMDQYIEQARKV